MFARRLLSVSRHPILPSSCLSCRTFSSVQQSFDYGDFIPSIGLEVHAQIRSESKLFSSSPTTYCSPPNANVSPFDAGLPGTLPVLNRHCLESAIRTGLALNCRISSESSFDRKHYFYADMPLGYQITQQANPIARDGFLDFAVYHRLYHKDAYVKRSIIQQVQLEQDSGKTLHDDDNDTLLIDLNRAGNPLVEIVFSPDLSDGEEAAALIRDLILLLRRIDTCVCKMEEGTLRVDANVSIRHRDEDRLGTRTEIKNLNSMRSIAKAIDYEIRRQTKLLLAGERVVNETMRFNVAKNETEVMRDKSDFADYRFMPEANLPFIRLKDSALRVNMHVADALDINDFRKSMPDSPHEERVRLIQKYDIDLKTAMQVQQHEQGKELFLWVMDQDTSRKGSVVFRVIFTEMMAALEACKLDLKDTSLEKEDVATLCDMVQRDEISCCVAQDILSMKMRREERSPQQLIQDYGWDKITDTDLIRVKCEEAIMAKSKRAKEVRNKGKKFAFDMLVLHVMTSLNRRVDLEVVEPILMEMLQPPQGMIKSGKERRAEREKEAAAKQ